MEIYIDESGLFVTSDKPGSWSSVAAFAVPCTATPLLESVMAKAKASVGVSSHAEIKLKHFQNRETEYFTFLENIARLDGLLFAIASDAAFNPPHEVLQHQRTGVASILKHVDRMRFEGGRRGVELLAAQIGNLSPQLYVQNACQIELMYEVVSRAINYFAQRCPETLGKFSWRVDRKDTSPSSFEAAFEKLSPALLQTISLSSPFIKVRSSDFDYTYLEDFEMPTPSYLKDDYGVETDYKTGLDIQRIIRGDIKFVDSAEWPGVQIVDLVVSGLRRCLRHGFADNERAAAFLGRLMVQAPRNRIPIRLLGFGASSQLVDHKTSRLVKVMRSNAKPMFRQFD